jgi:hypothetical protein
MAFVEPAIQAQWGAFGSPETTGREGDRASRIAKNFAKFFVKILYDSAVDLARSP